MGFNPTILTQVGDAFTEAYLEIEEAERLVSNIEEAIEDKCNCELPIKK